MNRSTLLILSIASLFAAVACASWWEKNETESGSETASDVVPFPGTEWLDRIADPSTAYTANDGKTYSSAYAAFLYGVPLEHPCRNFNSYLNSFVVPPTLASKILEKTGGSIEWAHYIVCYLRNFVLAMILYYGAAMAFHYHCYIHPRAERIFAQRPKPKWDIMWDQIKLAQASLFLYVLLPVVDEFLIESGWTLTYFSFDEIGGWIPATIYTVLYFSLVEIGIYWMHRTLHTNKFLYKHVHMLHHKYNRPDTLTPWASIAFHPLDGILQASPYVMVLPIVPIHYIVHLVMLFFTGLWATYIHDAMDFNIDPIMGSKYHTIHHTHYLYNYGQVFTFCDRIWGTLKVPDGPTGVPPTQRSKLEPTSRMSKKSN